MTSLEKYILKTVSNTGYFRRKTATENMQKIITEMTGYEPISVGVSHDISGTTIISVLFKKKEPLEK